MAMFFYRLLMSVALTLLRVRFMVRARLGFPGSPTLQDRLFAPDPRPGGDPLIWLHGASNGELASARTVMETLLARAPALGLLVTTNTESARRMVLDWNLPRTTVRIAPFDDRRLVAAFLARLRPAALVMVENELWPNRLLLCAQSGIPVFILAARMSERSARVWSRLPGLARKLTAAVRYLSAQDTASETRFRALGLPADRVGPPTNLKSANLKSAATRAAAPPPGWAHPREKTLLAASTHEGEETVVLDAFAAARDAVPGLRLILAPRHPRRRDAIEAEITRHGLAFATRSRGQQPGADLPVYLADTLGEMDLWYHAAGLCFVGGSLTDRGGHTPFEPAAHDAVILHGPHVANSAPAYAALARAGASIVVTDAASLATAIGSLADPARQTALGTAARAALLPLRDPTGIAAFYHALAAATGLDTGKI